MSNSKFLNIGVDFETIPTQNPEIIESIMTASKCVNVTPPSTKEAINSDLKEPFSDSVLKGMKLDGLKNIWVEQNAVSAVEREFDKRYRNTSFSAQDGGELISSSFMALDYNEEGAPLQVEPFTRYRFKGGSDEATLLRPIAAWLDNMQDYALGQGKTLRFVGARVRNFDMRFFVQRCMILGIPLPKIGFLYSRYDRSRYFDVLSAWNFDDDKASVSLDKLCRVLNVESPKGDDKGDINGSMVWDIWNKGGEEGAKRIGFYNSRDVAVLRPLFDILKQLEAN